jgi:Resolvase, N terminal domain
MRADEGQSLDVQERTIAGYALMHGMTIDQTFVERGVSGSKPLSDRPQGTALLAAIKPGDTKSRRSSTACSAPPSRSQSNSPPLEPRSVT